MPLVKKFIMTRSKLTRTKQIQILRLLADLMASGFSLQESLRFIQKLFYQDDFLREEIGQMLSSLAQGRTIDEAFNHFMPLVSSEIRLSEIHGRLIVTLQELSQRLNEEQDKWNQLQRLLSYPILLILFLLGLMIAMKWILFPKMASLVAGKQNVGFQIVNGFFVGLAVIGMVLVLLFWNFYYQNRHKTGLEKQEWLMKLPFVRTWCRYCATCYFCDSWGQLLRTGVETKQILSLLQSQQVVWMSELSCRLEQGMEEGLPMTTILEQYSFLHPGLIYLIKAGEAKGKLGDELLMYGKELWKQWINQIEVWLEWIQPLIFIIIGLLIICMYASVLLPMYTGLN